MSDKNPLEIPSLSDTYEQVLACHIIDNNLVSVDLRDVLNIFSGVVTMVGVDEAMGPMIFLNTSRREILESAFEQATYDEIKRQNMEWQFTLQAMFLKSWLKVMGNLIINGYKPSKTKESEETA